MNTFKTLEISLLNFKKLRTCFETIPKEVFELDSFTNYSLPPNLFTEQWNSALTCTIVGVILIDPYNYPTLMHAIEYAKVNTFQDFFRSYITKDINIFSFLFYPIRIERLKDLFLQRVEFVSFNERAPHGYDASLENENLRKPSSWT